MPSRRPLVLAFLLAAGLPIRTALAQDAGTAVVPPGAAAEIASLEAELARAAAQLSSGCASACPALASMERAAARICALDPGPRCTDARAKVRDAARKVQQACGECRGPAPFTRPPEPEKPDVGGRDLEEAPGAKPRKEHQRAAPVPQAGDARPPAAAPPPAEPVSAEVVRGRGCAGCAVAGDDREALGAGLLAAVAVAAIGLRRRRR